MTHSRFISFVMYVILLIVFLGLINMIFNLHRFAFIGQFLILLVLLLVAIISAIGINNNFSWAWKLLSLLFVIVFLDLFFVYAISTPKPDLFLPYVVTSVVGFFIALFNVISKAKVAEEVKKTYKPGKYIASKTGSKFHAPKCDWAKKIKKERRLWFPEKKDAQKKGYRKHSCVK